MAMLLMGVTTSCFKMEEADIFDENAAARLEKAITEYTQVLTDKGGKWMLEYYSNGGEPGYVYIMTFNKNGSVTMSGKNELIGELYNLQKTPKFDSESSLWEVIGDNGPVLSFNSYNNIFHLFADPEDIFSTETDEQGYGHEGDYEFDIMKYSGDTLYLDGKKYELHMLMTRLPESTNDEEFFNEIDKVKSQFSPLIPELYLTTPSGKRYVCSNASSMIWSIYPEGGDPITQTQTYNAIITPYGVRFMNPLYILADFDAGDLPVQAFKFQNGKLVAEDGETTISCDALGNVFTDSRFKWQIDAAQSSGELLDAYNAFSTSIKAYNKANLQYMQFVQISSGTLNTKALLFNVKVSSKALSCNLYCDMTAKGDNVSFKFSGEGDKNALVFYDNVPEVKNFLALLESEEYLIITDCPLGPSVLKITSKKDSNSYLTVNIIK